MPAFDQGRSSARPPASPPRRSAGAHNPDATTRTADARPWSNALRIPVEGPRGTVWLTSLQWTLWWYLRRPRRRTARLTLAHLEAVTGAGRGSCWRALTRLRSLELLGWRAIPTMELVADRRPRRYSPGCRAHLITWIPAPARRATSAALRRSTSGANDSVSSPYGTYLTRTRVETAWAAGTRRQPPRFGRPAGGLTGPRRGPPHILYGRCPANHSIRLGRWSWRTGPAWAPFLAAEFRGACRPCSADVVERLELVLPPPAGRGSSPAELADGGLVDRRIALASTFVDQRLHPAVGEQLRRDYLERDPAAPPWRPPTVSRVGSLLDDLAAQLHSGSRGTPGHGHGPGEAGGPLEHTEVRTDATQQRGSLGDGGRHPQAVRRDAHPAPGRRPESLGRQDRGAARGDARPDRAQAQGDELVDGPTGSAGVDDEH